LVDGIFLKNAKLQVGSRAKFFFSFRFGGARYIEEPRNLGCEIWFGASS
jgi:hypothetical protein